MPHCFGPGEPGSVLFSWGVLASRPPFCSLASVEHCTATLTSLLMLPCLVSSPICGSRTCSPPQAHRLLGTALLHLKHYPDAIRFLKKAVDLGASSGLPPENVHMVEAEKDLMRAKYEEWQVDAAARRERQRNLK